MNRIRRHRFASLLVAVVGVLVMLSVTSAQQKGKSYVFRGKVEKIDTKTKTLTVNGENVPGWMSAMTMTYSADKDDVVTRVKVGDEITATVYDGDFKVLHDVKVVPPKDAAPAKK
jgi:Cu/Ag efflux protein CusF